MLDVLIPMPVSWASQLTTCAFLTTCRRRPGRLRSRGQAEGAVLDLVEETARREQPQHPVEAARVDAGSPRQRGDVPGAVGEVVGHPDRCRGPQGGREEIALGEVDQKRRGPLAVRVCIEGRGSGFGRHGGTPFRS
ncbi:hypothetical protein AB0421_07450 [Streptomyces tsukubensis]